MHIYTELRTLLDATASRLYHVLAAHVLGDGRLADDAWRCTQLIL